MLSYEDARRTVIEVTSALGFAPAREMLTLARACGRVLAQPVVSDRDYPPFDRSTRDGFAVRAEDVAVPGATLACIGEAKAGSGFDDGHGSGAVGVGQCIEIMTGAAVPPGADAVVMVEHARLADGRVTFERVAERGQNIVQRGREAHAGRELLPIRTRLGVAEMAVAAQVGARQLSVYARPRVAVLSTGDEIVDINATPGPLQIRGSNGLALETLVELGGGEAVSLGNARDDRDDLRRRIERGLAEADMLVISGGVSKGKYDLVEDVLSELGAEFFFDAVAIRPGQPAVFGRCAGKPVLGLPGNPISSMVTFELFAQPAMDVLSGAIVQPQLMLRARVAKAVHERGALTRFLPAQVKQSPAGEPEVSVLPWQGSGDLVALASANAFLVVPPEKSDWEVGEWAMVLLRRGYGGEWC